MFSVGSRYLYQGIQRILSPSEWAQALRTAYSCLQATFTTVKSANDWSTFFGLTKDAPACRVGDILHGIGSTRAMGDSEEAQLPRCPKAFWIHRVGKRVVLHYKEYSADPVWMPFLRDPNSGEVIEPKTTDPQGIDLFAMRVPTLADITSLRECELRTDQAAASSESGSDDDDEASGRAPAPTEAAGPMSDQRKVKPPFNKQHIFDSVMTLKRALDNQGASNTASPHVARPVHPHVSALLPTLAARRTWSLLLRPVHSSQGPFH